MTQTELNPYRQVPPPAPRPPARAPLPMGTILQYVMLPGAAALCLQFSLLDAASKIIGSALVMLAFWIGFGRLNPLGVRVILATCILLSLKNFPLVYVCLMACSALAGWVGAWLSARDAEEDDFFFLPALALAGSMLLLVTLGAGGGWAGVLDRTHRLIGPWQREWVEYFIALRKSASTGEMVTSWFSGPEDALLARHMELVIIVTIVCAWVLGLWLAGRLARRILGRLRGVRSSLIVFRIQHRYIFLLILGLILEIFSSLGLSPTIAWLGWPILGVIGLAGFLEGVGIVLFVAAIRRMAGQVRAAAWLGALGLMMALFFPHFLALFGLADVWLDVRKLDKLKQQLEHGTDEPDE